jgi:hypothetical protein
MNLGRRAAVAALVVGVAGKARAQKALAVPPSWYVVQVEDNAFTVEMPGIPDHRVLNDKSPRGTPFALHSYSLDVGGYSYAAQTALYPDDVDTTQPRLILQAALNARAQRLAGGKWSKVDWRELSGAAVCESTGPLSGGNALRQLVALKQHRFVSIAFLGNAAGVTGADAQRFFGSFRLA